MIVAVDGTATPTADALGTVLAGLKPGQTVKVALRRQNGSSATAKVTLGEYPGS